MQEQELAKAIKGQKYVYIKQWTIIESGSKNIDIDIKLQQKKYSLKIDPILHEISPLKPQLRNFITISSCVLDFQKRYIMIKVRNSKTDFSIESKNFVVLDILVQRHTTLKEMDKLSASIEL